MPHLRVLKLAHPVGHDRDFKISLLIGTDHYWMLTLLEMMPLLNILNWGIYCLDHCPIQFTSHPFADHLHSLVCRSYRTNVLEEETDSL